MRLLILDHFFSQDIESLEAALAPGDELRVLDYDVLRSEALRMFPPEVASGLEAFTRPEHDQARQRYARKLRDLLADEFSRQPFDAFVSPSDTFFYVRAAPEACHELGVPFLVVQKETTISNLIMATTDTLRSHASPIADHMTVCGDRLRDFWLRAGIDARAITVTGQPRFDFYRDPDRWPDQLPYGDDAAPTLLFFSYHIDHHHPTQGQGVPVWERQHRETEEQLWDLAQRGWRVLVKPHPQQPWQAARKGMRREAGELLGKSVFLIEPRADARRLVVVQVGVGLLLLPLANDSDRLWAVGLYGLLTIVAGLAVFVLLGLRAPQRAELARMVRNSLGRGPQAAAADGAAPPNPRE